MQVPQSLTRADQIDTSERLLEQFCQNQLDERAMLLATGCPRTMQYRPYKRFAYPISVISEGQAGSCSFFGIVLNEACQTCRDDLPVRNLLKIFAVQEMRNRSLGWTRENI